MAPNSSKLGAALYTAESTFGDSSATSFGTRANIIGAIDVSGLTFDKAEIGYTRQRQNDGVAPVRTVRGGQFTIKMPLTGHGSTTAGSLTESDLSDLLGLFVGANRTADVGGTADGTGTAAAPGYSGVTAGSGTLVRVGALDDARGNGQYVAVGSVGGGVLTLLTALDAAPDNADVIYASEIIYPSETPTSTTITSTRWLLQTADQQYRCWGCYPMAIKFSGLNAGELPMVELTFGVATWDASSTATFPSATAADDFPVAPVAGGSFFFNTVGTATRALRDIRSFDLTINMETIPLMGPGSGDAHVIVRDARRVRCQAEFTITLDSEAAGTDTLGDEHAAQTTYKHALYTLSCSDGSAVGFYFPKCVMIGSQPVQTDMEGLNRKKATYRCFTGPTTSSDLLASNWRLALG